MDLGIELIITIEEDYIDMEILEKIAKETTQEVLSTRTILRILWTKTNILSIVITSICKLYIAITRKHTPSI
jgi:hypothetical protein